MLLGGADRHDQRRLQHQPLAYRARRHLLQSPGTSVLSHRDRWWWVTVAAVVIAAAEWLRAPALVWAAAAVGACLCAAAALVPFRGWRRKLAAALIAGIALAIVVTQRRLTLIERDWPHQLEARVESASRRLRGDLHDVFHLAERLAAEGALAADGTEAAAFDRLEQLIPARGVESGVAILDADGVPWAWAGRQRLRPAADGDSLAARGTGYYLVLETRRHSASGRVAVASVLIWAHPAVTDRSRSLAELFRERTEVGLEVYAAGTAPNSPNVFDYTEPTTAGDRLLFSTQPVPPTQGGARQLAATSGSRYVTWLLLVLVVVAISLGEGAGTRLAILPVGAWVAIRAPIGAALGMRSPFSPAAFYLPVLGPFTGSAAALALLGALLVVAGAGTHPLLTTYSRPYSICTGSLNNNRKRGALR